MTIKTVPATRITLVVDPGWLQVIANHHSTAEVGEVFRWESSEPVDIEVSDLSDTPHALHFGVFPRQMFDAAVVDGHDDREEEHTFTLYPANGFAQAEAYVSGSWKCWGPADQETEGDDSLHVVVYLPEVPSAAHVQALLWALSEATSDRIADFAYVGSSEDWSEISHIVTLASGEVRLYNYERSEA